MKLFLYLALGVLSICLCSETATAETVSFKTRDGGVIHADYYPAGDTAVVLAHGAIFNKESWHDLAKQLVVQNIGALAIDFRGYGRSMGGERPMDRFEDILAALHFLRLRGFKVVSVVGASMGGGIAGKAATYADAGEISRLILLSPVPIPNPEKMRAGKFLYIASASEGGIAGIKAQYQQTPEPKQITLLEGNAHAQHIFNTAEKNALIEIITRFLSAK